MFEVSIQLFNEKEEWEIVRKVGNEEEDWYSAIKEVAKLNGDKVSTWEGEDISTWKGKKYRAVCVNGFLTHIYCSGFYTVPTIRFY